MNQALGLDELALLALFAMKILKNPDFNKNFVADY
jgi:hypothetical protein